ncbi:MAG: hypothetical protein JNN15_12480, partial [Blastocatellia bacterium]|nr:hypothetical protein [Blastocatellia bacterium]
AKETIVRFMPDFGQGQQNGNESRPANARPAGAGPRLMNPDALMEFMKRLPEIKISELKPGDFVVTNGPKSEDGTSLNAIFLVKVQAPTIRSSEGPTFGNFGGLFGGPGGGNQ